MLNSGDQLFSELRDKNFNAIGPTLSSKAKAVSAKYDVRTCSIPYNSNTENSGSPVGSDFIVDRVC